MHDDYDNAPGIRWSTLKHMGRSPLHYRHAATQPKTEPTPAMVLGTAAHLAILEPARFADCIAVWEGGRRAGKAWEEWEATNAGKLQLKPDELSRIVAMAAAVRRHPEAAALLSEGAAEVPLSWTDPATGLVCKARADWLRPGVLVDLKTARDVAPRAFGRASFALDYPGQCAHYGAGVEALTGEHPECYIIAVESEEPHDVAVYRLYDDALLPARARRDGYLRRVAECEASGVWPGQVPEVAPLDLPSWALDFGGAE